MPGDAHSTGTRPSVAMLQAIKDRFLADLGDSVDWFYAAMPSYYFRVTDQAEQIRHLEVVHSLRRTSEAKLTMVDDGEAKKLLFVGRPATHSLFDVVTMLGERPFHRVELHTSRDASLFIHAFAYGSGRLPAEVDLPALRARIVAACCDAVSCVPKAVVERYLDAVDQGYLARSPVERVERHVRAWANLAGGAEVHVAIDDVVDHRPVTRILVAGSCGRPNQFLVHVARVIKRWNLVLERGYVDLVPAVDDSGRKVLISSVYVVGADGAALPHDLALQVAADLETIRRLYTDPLADLYQEAVYTLEQLELLRAAIGFSGQLLAADYPFLDIGEAGEDVVRGEPAICRGLCDLLALRFHPQMAGDAVAFDRVHADLLARIRACEPLAHAVLLEAMLGFVAAVRLTNLFKPDRLGIAFSIDPVVLPAARFPHQPYAVFYFSGHVGRGFHIRFRASARGGLRLVLPRNLGQYQRARDQLLKEVYDLAWAQQLKNKDIPEGGSKCIGLVEPGGDASAMVRQIVDPLIDLILPGERVPEVIGPHRAPRQADLIFLGPDENMTPERIVWVAERARVRGLPHHLTLMSSKPGSGINHKAYGVTSEGIFRWILQVLPVVGIAEGTPYTVKITGGPDGDLGGNLLRILHREHGSRCRVVAISDGTGHAYDAAGLDWDELLRLVEASAGIAGFSPSRLHGGTARVAAVTDKASEQARNSLHNTVVADLFVPCGGRPYTINDQNWKDFLGADGKPTARTMVEGANIFLTPAARRHLEDAGLVVIKDSSANKGGVICSSYEVLAGLVLSEAEFLARKPRYIAETIHLLRARADAEGRALLAAWKRRGKNAKLSELSQQISEEINRVSGLLEPVIGAHLDDPAFAQSWKRHLHRHCPPVLVEEFADRLQTRIPRAHRVAILSKRLASLMVYREGLTWCRNYLLEDRLWEVLGTYLEAEDKVAAVIEAVARMGLPNQEELIRIIAAGSQRELVRERLGQEF